MKTNVTLRCESFYRTDSLDPPPLLLLLPLPSLPSIFLFSLVPLEGWRRRRTPGVPPPRVQSRITRLFNYAMRLLCKIFAPLLCGVSLSSCISPRSAARRLFVDRRYRSGSGPRVMAHKFRGCVSNRLSLPIEGGEIERGDLGRSRGEGTWNRAERKEKFERFERFMLHGIVYGEYFSRRGEKRIKICKFCREGISD